MITEHHQTMEPKVCHLANNLTMLSILGTDYQLSRLFRNLFENPILPTLEKGTHIGRFLRVTLAIPDHAGNPFQNRRVSFL
jgi:hypothetical protein